MCDTEKRKNIIKEASKDIIEYSKIEFVGQKISLHITPDDVKPHTQHPDIDGYSSDVWLGQTLTVHFPRDITPQALATWLERDDVTENLAKVMGGMGVTWDGSNNVGTLKDEAQKAYDFFDDIDNDFEQADKISQGCVYDLFSNIRDDILRQETFQKALAFALETVDKDGILDCGDWKAYLDKEEIHNYVLDAWKDNKPYLEITEAYTVVRPNHVHLPKNLEHISMIYAQGDLTYHHNADDALSDYVLENNYLSTLCHEWEQDDNKDDVQVLKLLAESDKKSDFFVMYQDDQRIIGAIIKRECFENHEAELSHIYKKDDPNLLTQPE